MRLGYQAERINQAKSSEKYPTNSQQPNLTKYTGMGDRKTSSTCDLHNLANQHPLKMPSSRPVQGTQKSLLTAQN